MTSKYFTHFIAAADESRNGCEWSGIVELPRPLPQQAERHEMLLVLASNLDLDVETIRILDLSRLH